MMIEITCGNHREVFESPQGVHFVGVTVICNNHYFSVIDSYTDDDSYRRDERIDFEENLKVVFHYYSAPIVAEVVNEFAGFDRMKCIEIINESFYLCAFV